VSLLIAFLFVFLIALAALAFASIKVFSTRGADGRTSAPGCAGGCATAFALTLIGLIALATFIAGAVAISKAKAWERVVRSVPEMKVGVWREAEQRVHRDAEHPLHIVLEWQGHSEPTDELLRAVEEIRPGGDCLVTVDQSDPERTVIDFAIAADEHDLGELERALEPLLGDLALQDGVQVILRSVHADEAPEEDEDEER